MSTHTRASMRHDESNHALQSLLASHPTAVVKCSGEECARSAAAYERVTCHSLVVGLPDYLISAAISALADHSAHLLQQIVR
jgi:hypothetical protein